MGIWAQIAVYAISFLVSYAIGSSSDSDSDSSDLDSDDVPTCDEGTGMIAVFGQCVITNQMVLTYGNERTKTVKTSSSKK